MIDIRRRPLWDAILVALIFIGGQQVGSRYISLYQQTAHGDFYQDGFAPAVMVGCGRPFRDVAVNSPALDAFLQVKADSVSCDQLPPDAGTRDANFFQSAHRYLMTAVGWQWRVAGKVSWSALPPLFGILFGLTLCGVYGLLRLACDPIVSAVGVLPVAVSAHHLARFPHLRDYAKAPFFLLLLFVTVLVAIPPFKTQRSLVWSAVFGALLGISIGFRIDLILTIPVFLCAVMFFTPGRIRDHLKVKAGALGLAAVTFVMAGWPIVSSFGSHGGMSHVAILGLTTGFDRPLALTRPVYNIGHADDDTTAFAVITSHNTIHGGRFVPLLERDYENAGTRLLLNFTRHFPADVFIRAVSATLEVLDFPMSVNRLSRATPYGLTSPALLQLYVLQAQLLSKLAGIGPLVVVLSLLIVAARDLRGGIGLLLLVMYYGGSVATQFDFRNYFHLEFLAWWALVFVISTAVIAVISLFKRQWPKVSRPVIRNVGLMAAITIGIVLLPAATLRAYQQSEVRDLIDRYLAMPRVPLQFSTIAASGHVHVDVPDVWEGEDARADFSTRYLVAEFAAEHCRAVSLPVRVTYQPPLTGVAKTSRVPIASTGSTLRLIPVYRDISDYHFTGFDLPLGYEGCLRSVSRLSDLRDVPLLLDLTLDPDWRATHLYQRLMKWEGDGEPAGSRLRLVPEDHSLTPVEDEIVVPRDADITRVLQPHADDIGRGITVSSAAGPWLTQGPTKTPSSHQLWLAFPEQPLDARAILRVRGFVRKGGLRIGTTVSGHVVDSTAVLSPGPFLIMIGVREAGQYGVRVADESAPEWRREGNSWLRRIVWLTVPSLLSDDFELQELAWIHLPAPR